MRNAMWLRLTVALAACLHAASGGAAEDITLTPDGEACLYDRHVSVGVTVFERGWRGFSLSAVRGAKADPATGCLAVELRDREERVATGTAKLRALPDGRAEYALTMTFGRDFATACHALRVGAETDAFGGAKWSSDTAAGETLPVRFRNFPLGVVRDVRSFRLTKADGSAPLVFALEKPFIVDMYDTRKYGGTTFDFRLQYQHRHFRKGETVTLACTIDAGEPLSVARGEPIVVQEGPDWRPMPYLKDPFPRSALDLSVTGLHDAPAGKYGRVVAKGGHFEFERLPGVKQRFSGVNLCGLVNYPEPTMRKRFTQRLKRLGYNSVRFHHYESDLVAGGADRLSFNPEILDRFDAFVRELIDEGLYLTTDLYVSRPVEWKDLGIDRPGRMTSNAYKVLVSAGYGPAVENWKRFARAFLTHVNPYTGRSLVDEPALVSLVLVNEAHLGMDWDAFLSVPELKARHEAWKKANPGGDDLLFRCETEAKTDAELVAWLRALGVKTVLSTDNNPPLVTSRLLLNEPFDCVDQHTYLDHPAFRGKNIRYADDNPLLRGDLHFTTAACVRDWRKPFTISEWNYGGTSSYRSMAGLLVGSLASLQDWDAMWRFCCSHNDKRLVDNAGWVDSFELASDPLKQATDFAFNLLYLRGDLAPLRERMALRLTEKDIRSAAKLAPHWRRTALFERGYGVTTGADVPGVKTYDFAKWAEGEVGPQGGVSQRSRGTRDPAGFVSRGLSFDPANGTFSVATLRTCGGFAEVGVTNRAGSLTFCPSRHRATVTAMSLDGKPLVQARRILLTHLTNVLSPQTTFTDKTRRVVSYLGNSDRDRLVANGSARIALALDNPAAYAVWALATDGRRLAQVPASVEGGQLVFTASVDGAGGTRIFYEIISGD